MSSKKKNFLLKSEKVCVFCYKDTNLCRELIHRKNFSVHHDCLFFASGLSQRGKRDNDGVLGFLLTDISKEVQRGQKLKCFYCKKSGATVGCSKSFCRRTYHLPCGIKNGSLQQSYQSFKSYCKSHRPHQKPIQTPMDKRICLICISELSRRDFEDCLYSPCCRNWFHRACLGAYAFNAGLHFLKCPLCNNVHNFMEEMQFHGIYIPEKDASWELETNAYQELAYRPPCKAAVCICPHGPKHSGKGAWVLIFCSNCGSDARHKDCENLESTVTTWLCKECGDFEVERTKKQNSTELPVCEVSSPSNPKADSEKNSESDVVQQPVVFRCEVKSDEVIMEEPILLDRDKVAVKQNDSKEKTFSMDTSVRKPHDLEIADSQQLNLAESPVHVSSVHFVSEPSCSNTSSTTSKSENISALINNPNLPQPVVLLPRICDADITRDRNMENIDENLKMPEQTSTIKNVNSVLYQNNIQLGSTPAILPKCNSVKSGNLTVQQRNLSKKHKTEKFSSGCCSDKSQKCLKRMFGMECHSHVI
ncbi:hypothetical protein CDAR_555061 [Caerostris darwini]|uniref:G2/M phase-specific E3 ubiquitin-protein ligase n=1 Tax=Caerostris darwini TaxID=1538125 RepID=A0AAV4RG13_9ARAC|nr:hypothetical protein CDAR_555061 [Caerostris darwini]